MIGLRCKWEKNLRAMHLYTLKKKKYEIKKMYRK